MVVFCVQRPAGALISFAPGSAAHLRMLGCLVRRLPEKVEEGADNVAAEL